MGQNNHSCSMVGIAGIIIQIGLGVLSFSVLIIKRYRQRPQRPWKIWMFDTSKQVFSQLLAHFLNLTISIVLAKSDAKSDECLWYFITNIFDNTIGVTICIMCLKIIDSQLKKYHKTQYISGNYYLRVSSERYKASIHEMQDQNENNKHQKKFKSENNHQQKINQIEKEKDIKIQENREQINSKTSTQLIINYKAWLVQLAIWNGVVMFAKCILFGLQMGLQQPLKKISLMTMGWIQKYPTLQLIVVIVIVPVFMNGLAFWVQDNFLKKKQQTLQTSQLLDANYQNQPKQQQI